MKIKLKLSLLLLASITFFLSITSIIIYYYEKERTLSYTYDHLEAIAETKSIRIDYIIQRRYELINLLSTAPSIAENLYNFLERKDPYMLKNISEALLRYQTHGITIRDSHVTDTSGNVLVSTKGLPSHHSFSQEEIFKKSMKGENYLDGFFFDEENNLNVLLGGPVVWKDQIIGTLILEISAEEIVSLTEDYTGLGRTGETTLAQLREYYIFLTHLRFDKDAALHRMMPAGDPQYATGRIFMEKKDGFYEDIKDYRGKEVIASGRYFPESQWALITKMDREEVMEPIMMLKRILFIMLGISILAALLIAFIAGNYLIKPIERLTDSAREIEKGDLSKRVSYEAKDELGDLAQAFNRMAGRLEKKLSELDRFAYVISHDLKAPLHAIGPLIGFIKEDYKNNPLDKEGDEMLDMALIKVDQMERLIQSILESAREEKKAKERINLYALLNEILVNLSPPDHINIQIQPDMPFVDYHKTSLIQVFQNLLSNAIKFMDKPEGLVEVGYQDEGNHYIIFVKDNGPGIEEKDYEKIFEMFGTTSTNQKIDSTGLGLSIVKKVVTENGGRVWVESKRREGTTFYFTIGK